MNPCSALRFCVLAACVFALAPGGPVWAQEVGYIHVTSNPSGASVSIGIGTAPIGETPLVLERPPGTYTLFAEDETFGGYELRAVVQSGDTTSVFFDLVNPVEPGYLTVTSGFAPPEATVFANDTLLGQTPLLDLTLSPGTYTLRAERTCFPSQFNVLTLAAGEQARWNIEFEHRVTRSANTSQEIQIRRFCQTDLTVEATYEFIQNPNQAYNVSALVLDTENRPLPIPIEGDLGLLTSGSQDYTLTFELPAETRPTDNFQLAIQATTASVTQQRRNRTLFYILGGAALAGGGTAAILLLGGGGNGGTTNGTTPLPIAPGRPPTP